MNSPVPPADLTTPPGPGVVPNAPKVVPNAPKVVTNATAATVPVAVTVPLKDRMKFFRQFATCIKSGMTIAGSLKHLAEETSHPDLKEAARKAQICAEGGGRLSAWMKTRPHVFSPREAAFVLVGETGGALEEAIDGIATDLEEEVGLRRRIFLATFFAKFILLPLMLLSKASSNFMVYGLDGLEKATPGLSKLEQQKVILRSGFKGYLNETAHFVLPLLFAVVIFCIAWRLFVLTPKGRRVADQIALWTPGTGPLWRDWSISRYLTALSLLSRVGMAPAPALDACRGLAGNVVLDEKFAKAARLAREQNLSIFDAISRTGILSAPALSILRTGDHVGAMPEMLGRAAAFYESDVRTRLVTVPKTVGYITFAVCATAVGFIFCRSVQLYFNNSFTSVDRFMEMR